MHRYVTKKATGRPGCGFAMPDREVLNPVVEPLKEGTMNWFEDRHRL